MKERDRFIVLAALFIAVVRGWNFHNMNDQLKFVPDQGLNYQLQPYEGQPNVRDPIFN